jgi:hypothetical protein
MCHLLLYYLHTIRPPLGRKDGKEKKWEKKRRKKEHLVRVGEPTHPAHDT